MSDDKVKKIEAQTEDEIAQILNDIDHLQKDIEAKVQSASKPAPALKVVAPEPEPEMETATMAEFHAGSDAEVSMEETLSELPEDEGAGVHSLLDERPAADTHSGGTLAMTLSGQMKLELRYQSSEREVTLQFEHDTLIVKMSDGAEFKLPMGGAQKRRAA